jgi:hypothetical protein
LLGREALGMRREEVKNLLPHGAARAAPFARRSGRGQGPWLRMCLLPLGCPLLTSRRILTGSASIVGPA